DRHHVAMYVSRRFGTWPDARAYVDNFVFLWDDDRRRATSAGLPDSSCAVVQHPFDPFFLERAGATLGPRLSGILGPAVRGLVFAEPRNPRGIAGAVHDVIDEGALERIRERNRDWIEATPSWTAVAKTFVSMSGREQASVTREGT